MSLNAFCVSVSTSMFSPNPLSEASVGALLDSGISCVELGVDLSAEDLGFLHRKLTDGVLSVSSVHNYCPRPLGIPYGRGSGDLFSLSALDEAERKRAVRYACRTIELARSFDCKYIVLHCGDVPEATALRKRSRFNMFVPARPIRDEIMDIRRREVHGHLNALRLSIEQLLEVALERGIVLGLENRFHLDEIPSFAEAHMLVGEFQVPGLGTWLDTGHAFVHANCLGSDALAIVSEFRGDFVGCHIHDVSASSDHLVPGTGIMPLARVLAEIGPLQPWVLELSPGTTAARLKQAIRWLQVVGGAYEPGYQ